MAPEGLGAAFSVESVFKEVLISWLHCRSLSALCCPEPHVLSLAGFRRLQVSSGLSSWLYRCKARLALHYYIAQPPNPFGTRSTNCSPITMSRYPDYLSPNPTPTKLSKNQKSRARREPSGVFSLFQAPQIQQFKEAFQLIDHDKDGWVNENDLKEIFASLGVLAHYCWDQRPLLIPP